MNANILVLVFLVSANLWMSDLIQVVHAGGEPKSKSDDLKNELTTSRTSDKGVGDNGHAPNDSRIRANVPGDKDNESSSDSDEEEVIRSKLVEMMQAPGGDPNTLLVWKVENGRPTLTDLEDYRAFKSHQTYVVVLIGTDLALLKKLRMDDGHNLNVSSLDINDGKLTNISTIHYWMGENSTHTDISAAASHAMIIDAMIHQTVAVHRELGGHESSSFKAAFEQNGTASSSSATIPNTMSNENTKMMFLIREDYMARFTEVNLSLKHFAFESNICLVLNSAVLYTYCGHSASENLKKLAEGVAKRTLEKRDGNVKQIIIHRNNKESSELKPDEKRILQTFFAEFTPVSVTEEFFDRKLRSSGRHMESISEESEQVIPYVPIIRIYSEDKRTVSEEKINREHTTMSSFRADECYIVDMGSDVGLFVWIGENTADIVRVRKATARRAELLLKEKGYSRATPILYADERNVNIPATVYLSDLIMVMKNVKLPLSWILMPDRESISQAVPEADKCTESA